MSKRVQKVCIGVAVLFVIFGVVVVMKNYYQKTVALTPMSTENNVYHYPIYPGDKEWAKYDAREKNQMLQIPEEVLSGLSTQDLVKVVMDYPFLSDIFYYDSYRMGFKTVIAGFNGLDELLKRQDAATALARYYKDIDFTQEVDLSDARAIARNSNYNALEIILAQPEINSAFTDSQLMELEANIEKNMKYRKNHRAFVFALDSNGYYISLEENKTMSRTSVSTVKTPNGTEVDVDIITSEWNIYDKLNLRAAILANFPNVTILDDATKKYNCHAYAWASRTNVWLNDPSAYWQDGSYTYIGPSVTSYTQRVTYPDVNGPGISHSAYSSSYDGSVMWSKWGASCLVEHSVYDCPYGIVLTPPFVVSVYKR